MVKKNRTGQKAQFFILSALIIVSLAYMVSRWIEPLEIVDTSSVALAEEPFIFNNIKEKAVYAVSGSKSCEDLAYNILEYKRFVEGYTLGKNLKLSLTYSYPPCIDPTIPIPITFQLSLSSSQMDLSSDFTTFWPS